MTNILLVDDHQIIIDGLRRLLEGEENIGVLHEAQNGAETIKIATEEAVDLILLDINLPDKSGFDICKELKSQSDDCPKIIALTMYGNAGYINKMIKAGVDGYLLKNTGREELLKAIDSIMKGERYFSKEVTDTLVAGAQPTKQPKSSDFIQKLTRREKEILQLITEEYTTDEIAGKLFISSTTVITHRKSLLRKLNAKNVAGLVKKAFEFGLLND
ncbi:MAG: response regulator transcription factor [Bacteroidetes bacterium]|jgi:DNA-binding NarL/FixJ family response regulator|nr:response regulator transcription factor [Bacteroidota bacterium]MDF1865838.1 response regulator transcription factor [Saprospiraceae bacterium]